VCTPAADEDEADAGVASGEAPFGVLRPREARPGYRWNKHLDPDPYQPLSIFSKNGKYEERMEAWKAAPFRAQGEGDGVKGETRLNWGLGGEVRGVQRMQVLNVVEEMARFWREAHGDLFMAEILHRRALELCLTEVHPYYVTAAARVCQQSYISTINERYITPLKETSQQMRTSARCGARQTSASKEPCVTPKRDLLTRADLSQVRRETDATHKRTLYDAKRDVLTRAARSTASPWRKSSGSSMVTSQ